MVGGWFSARFANQLGILSTHHSRFRMASLQGHFLVAAPELSDPNFYRTVVFIVQHSDQGALGLVLNRPAPVCMKELWEKAEQGDCPRDDRVMIGGPCQGPLMVLHDCYEQSDIEPLPGVFYTGQSDHIIAVVNDVDRPARFFVGYAGWGEGQLENELQAGGWIVVPASSDDIFSEHHDLWERLLKRAGREKLLDMLHLKGAPDDPSVN